MQKTMMVYVRPLHLKYRKNIGGKNNATNIYFHLFFFSDIFRGCTGLKDLSLAANFLRQWPQKALRTLALHLHTLDMGENR